MLTLENRQVIWIINIFLDENMLINNIKIIG